MNELIKINPDGKTTARELYDFLRLTAGSFARWAKKNIEENEFYSQGTDWWGFSTMLNGNDAKDYYLTIDFAKHLCMLSRSERGKQARCYFVEIENRYKAQPVPEITPPDDLIIMLAQRNKQLLAQMAETQKQVQTVSNRVDQVEAKIEKRITSDFSLQIVNPSQIGKMFEPALSAIEVNKKIQAAGLQWRSGGEWIASAEGKKYSSSEPVQCEDGQIRYQLKWQRRVKDLILEV